MHFSSGADITAPRHYALCRLGRLAIGCLLGLALAVTGSTIVVSAKEVCKAPEAVCEVRQSVFQISTSFVPYGSAVRIATDLLVTNRHLVADAATAKVHLPGGEVIEGSVVPTSYRGDLILVRAPLPDGPIVTLSRGEAGQKLFSVGYDLSRKTVNAYAPGVLLVPRAPGKPFARLHHTAYTQPGNSGGALVDAKGELVGIAASGGEGRFEAVPADQIEILKAESSENHADVSAKIGGAYRLCRAALDKTSMMRGPVPDLLLSEMVSDCQESENRQFMDLAGQLLGRARKFDQSIKLFGTSLARDPNAVNTRLSLVATLHYAGRASEELPHIRWLLKVIPSEPLLLRYAVQAAKWNGDQALIKDVIELIETHDPRQLQAAKNFIERGPSSPPRGSFQ